ncbi:MAG: hypothetical protein K6A80_02960 [Saccharofermentans sp.]|nr:hypothetical protein [Saccharofermentans sp.]
MKTKITTLVSLIIVIGLFAGIAAFTSKNQKDQTLSFSIPVQVSDNQIDRSLLEPVYFNPVGESCEFTIDISGMDEFISNIKIETFPLGSDPIYSASATNTTIKTGELDVQNKGIFVLIDPEIRQGADLEDQEYLIRYTLILHTDDTSILTNGLIILVTIAIIIFAAVMLLLLNKSAKKDFDERQLKARGTAAMNALIVTLVTAMGIAMIGRSVDNFPLSVFEIGIIICLTGAITFLINADITDAFFGMKAKRFPLAIIYTIVGVMELMMSGIYNLIFKVGAGHELSVVSLVTGIYFFAVGIEMIIKGLIDRKEAKADEES